MKKILYSSDRATQIVVSLLKEHGVKYVVASPGVTSIAVVTSMQHDPYFKMFSCYDERSAAYMACGIAAQTGEPVALACTEATASRNYMPALTEAYYRKLPVVAITCNHGSENVGHLSEQSIDRSQLPKDIAIISVNIDDNLSNAEHVNTINVNKALLELRHHGGGPVHINLCTRNNHDFFTKELPPVRVIRRYMPFDELPSLPKGRIGIFVGAHKEFSVEEVEAIDAFCLANDAVVFVNKASGYRGKYKIESDILLSQRYYNKELLNIDLLIHIGEVGSPHLKPSSVWRVSEDGQLRDRYKRLVAVFEMREVEFFKRYTIDAGIPENTTTYYQALRDEIAKISGQISELPFSNMWIAKVTAPILPKNSILHLGILNSFRCWNLFETDQSVMTNCNVGGFGIDGCLSTLMGASFVAPEKICFCILGDLAAFYDINCIANRHVGSNVRIMVVNNGKGQEFRNFGNPGYVLGDMADKYVAAAGHNGNKSHTVLKSFAEALGYEYMCANNKEEYLARYKRFLTPEITERPMLFECFTEGENESASIQTIGKSIVDKEIEAKTVAKEFIKNSINIAKGIIGS